MGSLTKAKYQVQKAECQGLCDINQDLINKIKPNVLPCVTCPFCKQIVDAVLTATTIGCPACKIVVAR